MPVAEQAQGRYCGHGSVSRCLRRATSAAAGRLTPGCLQALVRRCSGARTQVGCVSGCFRSAFCKGARPTMRLRPGAAHPAFTITRLRFLRFGAALSAETPSTSTAPRAAGRAVSSSSVIAPLLSTAAVPPTLMLSVPRVRASASLPPASSDASPACDAPSGARCALSRCMSPLAPAPDATDALAACARSSWAATSAHVLTRKCVAIRQELPSMSDAHESRVARSFASQSV